MVQDKEIQSQQHIAETENEKEDEVHAQEEHQMEDDIKDAQIFWEQTDNDHKIDEIAKVEQNTEQLFKEGQANKAIQEQEALKNKLQTRLIRSLELLKKETKICK
eukprot:14984338-Heterocapsa_arctica.AAC.1